MSQKSIILILSALCACCIPAHADKTDRGITSLTAAGEPFMPGGRWAVGGTVSVSSYSTDKYSIAVINGIDLKGYNFSVKPNAMYAFTDDFAIGLSLDYSRIKTDLLSAGVTVSGVSINVNDYCSISSGMTGAILCRKYLTLGTSGRFALFVDAALSLGGSQSRVSNRQTGGIVGTYENTFKIALNVNPGVAAHITEHLMLGLGVGILGVEGSWTDQVHNQVANGSREGFGASYMLNILAISLGVYYSF